MMWRKWVIVISIAINLKNIVAQEELYVGDKCVPNDQVDDGVCTIITDCEIALRAIRIENNLHNYQRCGFKDQLEIVCCPRSSTRFGQPDNSDRKAEKECKKIIEASKEALDLHIIAGEKALLGEFPHMVALGKYDEDLRDFKFDAGGSLISDTYVLTAAHGVTVPERVRLNFTAPEIIRAGVLELDKGWHDQWHEDSDYIIEQIIIHPEYKRSQKYHDIALIRLEKAVKLSEFLHPACLYTRESDPLTPLTITGWGRYDRNSGKQSSILLKGTVYVASLEQCSPQYSSPRLKLKLSAGITEDQLCAGDPQRIQDTCEGDSGGPLQMPESGHKYIYRIVGVTSFGSFCGSKHAVYTRVSRYVDWIESVVWPN